MSAPAMLGRAALLLALLLPAAAWAQSSAAPFTIGYRYDAGGRQAGVILPDPDGAPNPLKYAATRNSYDASGNLWKVEKGELQAWQDETILPVNWSGFTVFQTETIAYDARGRKIRTSIIGPDGTTVYGVTQYSYDDYDRPVCATVRMNPAEFATPPADACTQGSQGADRITKTSYDMWSRVTTVKKALGTPREQNYTTYTYSATYALTDLDKPASITDANGNTTTMVYGGSVFNHITRMNFPSPTTPGQASATDYEAYTYDANGNRLSSRKRNSCVIGYTYDVLNRMTRKDMPNGVIGGVDCGTAPDVYYGYDLRGLQLYARFGSATGTGITNSYDGFGRQKSTMSDVYGPPRTFNYLWDADGNRTQLAFQNGLYYTYEYDGLDRLTTIRVGGTNTDIDTIVTDTYDPQGRRATETRRAVTTTYGYDEVSRLKSISDHFAGDVGKDVTTTFGRNPASQIVRKDRSNDLYAFGDYVSVSRSYAVNGLNQYTSASPASFTYDANGNLTGDGTQTYTYDVENRLIAKSGGTGGSASLDYDPLGRLWRVTLPAKVITFTYDGDAMVTEQNGSALYRFVHGNGDDDPLVWFDGPSATAEHLRSNQVDQLGSVVSTANASGVATAINSYDEYGIPDADNSGRFQYTGQIWLPEVGLYYYKARMYSPTLGRFMQTDPIGYKDQINLYAYVGNDPLDGRDPTGLYDCSKDDCAKFAPLISALRYFANSYKPTDAGGRRAVRDARSALSVLGNENDGNGLTVKNGSLNTNYSGGKLQLGAGSRDGLTVDFRALDVAARRMGDNSSVYLGAAVVGHEGMHAFQDFSFGVDNNNLSIIYQRERQAYNIESYVDSFYGVPAFDYSRRESYITDHAKASCTTVFLQHVYDSGTSFKGDCK